SLSNPAGLMLLARPEFFIEIRDTNTDSSSIQETFQGQDIASSTEPRAIFSPSFISYVHPWKRFAAGISRIEINKSSNVTRSTFTPDPNAQFGFVGIGGTGSIDTDLSVWNLTGAMKVTNKISIGATVALGILNMQSAVNNFFIDSDPNSPVFNVP